MILYGHFLHWLQIFNFLGAWQQRGLALWCCGVVLAQACHVSAVVDALLPLHPASSAALSKRLSRFLSNPRISDQQLTQVWIRWVAQHYREQGWVILVDETKLSNHLSVMMVALAYHQRAIPLLWRCYRPQAYPQEGQVALISELLACLRLLVPPEITLTVQADRGIGTSPALIKELQQLGLRYLLRVQGQTRLRLANRKIHTLASLVKPGEDWCGRAEVFKKAGWLRLYVRVYWRQGEASPWCLVTDTLWLQSHDYTVRAWHEHGFRDLKSFGFQWQRSQIWQPEHAHRLLFILTLAYTWVMIQALLHTNPERLSPSRSRPRESLFRRGLRWVRQQKAFRCPQPFYPDIFFSPLTPLLC